MSRIRVAYLFWADVSLKVTTVRMSWSWLERSQVSVDRIIEMFS